MNDDEHVIGIFLYGLGQLQVDDNRLIPDANDEDDLQTIGALCVQVYRITAAGITPFDMALSRLAVLTGALLISPTLGHGPDIVRKWLLARSEVLELQLTANK
jgi:hypothetical protein